MDNPIGGIRRGWDQIVDGYSKLFKGQAKVRVTSHDFTSQGADDWHLFVGREQGVCRTARKTIDVAFRTTRWFVRRDGGWRQLHHHGSVEDPKMLADYQNRSSDKLGRSTGRCFRHAQELTSSTAFAKASGAS